MKDSVISGSVAWIAAALAAGAFVTHGLAQSGAGQAPAALSGPPIFKADPSWPVLPADIRR